MRIERLFAYKQAAPLLNFVNVSIRNVAPAMLLVLFFAASAAGQQSSHDGC